jgi:hypothetical protein
MRTPLTAPADVKSLFDIWRLARRGESNPEMLTNPVWNWLVETNAWPLQAHRAAGQGKQLAPGWCFSRVGQSETVLDDGSTVFIGGEHEDFYDPDFFIYNDVIVRRADGTIDIYGYPTSVFPPTDFHSATLVGDVIYIIGRAGYPADRQPDHCPVYSLDFTTFEITRVTTSGHSPPGICSHRAEYLESRNSIRVSDGELTNGFTENTRVWELDLQSCAWTSG